MYLIICLLILAPITFVQARLAFTQSPTVVTVGKPTVLKWIGENHSLPVFIVLWDNDGNGKLLSDHATNGSFTWIPSADLPAGIDYSLTLSQEDSEDAESDDFILSGESGSPAHTPISHALPTVTLPTVAATTSASASSKRSTAHVFTVPSRAVATIYVTPAADSTTISSPSSRSTKTIVAIAVALSVSVIGLVVLGFSIYRCRRKRKELEKVRKETIISPIEPQMLSGHREYELSTGVKDPRPELAG